MNNKNRIFIIIRSNLIFLDSFINTIYRAFKIYIIKKFTKEKLFKKNSWANPGIEPGSHAPEACILPVD